MEIVYKDSKQDIFKSECECITNPVNSIGIMGAGLAKKFLQRYPKQCEHFNQDCKDRQEYQKEHFKDGIIWVTPELYLPGGFTFADGETPYSILMFTTKRHWAEKSRLEYIEEGLFYAFEDLNKAGIQSVAFPALGCGLGGLKRDDVFEIIESKTDQYFKGNKVEIYEG
jgi:O-acetyl-ADP-ribose deacetylase (regulator of RNase III)